jgi:peptidoglycan/xylan/chitin deacetylase (PgdA/CDA1 family)
MSRKSKTKNYILSTKVLTIISALFVTFIVWHLVASDHAKALMSKPVQIQVIPKQAVVSKLRVPILTYHKIREYKDTDTIKTKAFITTPEEFEKQMKYLHDHGYNVITFTDLLKGFNGLALPKKPVILTFDDGYANQYVNALSILEKYHLVGTFFIFTNAISSYHDYMTWDEIKDLHQRGMSIGAHTKSHPKLTKIKTEKELEDEIVGGKQILEEKLGIPIEYFAYPYGLNNYITIDVVKKAGFLLAVGIKKGDDQELHDIYKLERDNMNSNFISFLRAVQ